MNGFVFKIVALSAQDLSEQVEMLTYAADLVRLVDEQSIPAVDAMTALMERYAAGSIPYELVVAAAALIDPEGRAGV